MNPLYSTTVLYDTTVLNDRFQSCKCASSPNSLFLIVQSSCPEPIYSPCIGAAKLDSLLFYKCTASAQGL